jgi:streptogramin lyase
VPLTPLKPVESVRITLPEGVVSAFGSIWVTGHHSRTAFRLDKKTGAILARIPGIGPYAQWPFSGGGLVWVPSENSLAAIDPGTNSVVRTFPGQVASGAFASGHPWVDDAHDSLVELDPKTGAPLLRLKSGSGFPEDCFNQVRFGDGSLWWSVQDAGLVVRIDPSSGRVLASISGVGQNPSETAFAAGGVWVSSVDGSVREIDPRKNSVSTVTTYAAQLPSTCEDPTVGQGDTIWVGHGGASLLYGFDGRTRTVTHVYDLGRVANEGIPGFSQLQGIAADGRSLWIPFYQGNQVQRFDPP